MQRPSATTSSASVPAARRPSSAHTLQSHMQSQVRAHQQGRAPKAGGQPGLAQDRVGLLALETF